MKLQCRKESVVGDVIINPYNDEELVRYLHNE